ncbi:MAG: hypothetical protein JOZ81_20205 [Chloroflexi bacterium]|nr:hypothetical protein [Chloroflexota bacterium]
MYAINHAATALLFKKHYPDLRLLWLLLAVQFVEVLWVVFNYLGIERTILVGGVTRLAYMPYSHSVVMMLFWAVLAWALFALGFRQATLGLALGLAVGSHLVLDLATHQQDIALAPGLESIKLGSGLYGVPLLAFIVETAYGIGCWWVYRGRWSLLAAIIIFNVINLPLFFAAGGTPDPNAPSSDTNYLAVTVVFIEILVTWFFVWRFGRQPRTAGSMWSMA